MSAIFIKTKRIFHLFFTFSIIFFIGIIIQGCNGYIEDIKEDTTLLDESILESQELEDYIIAGADFQQSLTTFAKALNEIDFSKLEVTYAKGWKKIVRIPITTIESVIITEKIKTFNDRKEALLSQFPQMASLDLGTSAKYFKHSIKNSVKVQGEFLKMGINPSRSMLKSGDEAYYNTFGTQGDLLLFLSSWATNPDYVEISIYMHEDGTWSTYWHPGNTADSCNQHFLIRDEKLYTNGGHTSPVIQVGHTHSQSIEPSPSDTVPVYGGVNYNIEHFIYYNNEIRYYE